MLVVLLNLPEELPRGVVLVPLAGIAISAYNAFGRGVAVYEAELDDADRAAAACQACGRRTSTADRYCRSCGAESGAS